MWHENDELIHIEDTLASESLVFELEHIVEECVCDGKWCPGCEQLLCVGAFHKSKNNKMGLAYRCRECSSAYAHRWYQENTDNVKARTARWQKDHPEKRVQYNARYKQSHKEQVKAQDRSWRERNAERRREYRREYEKRNRGRVNDYALQHYYKNLEESRLRHQKWREQHREQVRAYNNAYKRRHRQAMKEYGDAYNRNNVERIMQYNKQWTKRNPERYRVSNAIRFHRRRARKTQAGGSYTQQEWSFLKAKYDYTCLCCGRKEPEITLTADHVIPVSKGGHSNIDNIQPLCNSCNSSKNVKIVDYRLK